MKEYFEQIEKSRKDLGITILELCKEVGIAIQTYHNAKSGRNKLSVDVFIKMCKAVNLNLNLD